MDPRLMEQIVAEARHARERRDLYRARLQSGRAATLARMRELEHAHQVADERLQTARRDVAGDT